jgi:hypothetical protein
MLAGEEGIPSARAKIRSTPPCGVSSPHVFFLIPADAEAAVGMGTGETLPIGKAVGAARHSIHSFLAVVSGGASGRQDRCRRRCLAASRGEGPGSFKPWLFAAEAFVG